MSRINWPELSATNHDFLSALVNDRRAEFSSPWQQWGYNSLGKPKATMRVSVTFEISHVHTGKLVVGDNPDTLMVGVSQEAEFRIEGVSDALFVANHETRVGGGLMFDWEDSNRFQYLVDYPDAMHEFVELVAEAYARSQRKFNLFVEQLM